MYTINGISASYNTVVMPSFTLGTVHLSDHQASVYIDDSKSSPTLGLDVLANYHLLMDFQANKMYLQPNASSVNITVKPPSVPAGNAER